MVLKALSLSGILGLFLVIATTGCDNHSHSHDKGIYMNL